MGEDGNHYLLTSIVYSKDVLPGDSYKLRVRAHNVHGWGEWSTPTIILSTGIPDAPDAPQTVINN